MARGVDEGGHGRNVSDLVAFFGEGSQQMTVLSCSADKTVRIWEPLRNPQKVQKDAFVARTAFSRMVVFGGATEHQPILLAGTTGGDVCVVNRCTTRVRQQCLPCLQDGGFGFLQNYGTARDSLSIEGTTQISDISVACVSGTRSGSGGEVNVTLTTRIDGTGDLFELRPKTLRELASTASSDTFIHMFIRKAQFVFRRAPQILSDAELTKKIRQNTGSVVENVEGKRAVFVFRDSNMCVHVVTESGEKSEYR
uniref:Uncharacterized protein n=1 Tax=Chromera velia CCMP2878 TaxID=1169474 RepID=A0A0G4FY70_9ALVE|eukprot:Cvel_19362.t1-p1 / transcript=Cvel_19362.t1 / gene=Cvel_19362 / organism=Chromera_velia_CCMP2878 / gene_product=hypothetical protein / transcript_product=hypothetical protein / location=Cvel_scaffold1664:5105-7502(+) / protein_length=252 / sequence_SO=supercontig / SO=protein_coding / is_pseudo=false